MNEDTKRAIAIIRCQPLNAAPSSGTCFLVAAEYALTAAHVVGDRARSIAGKQTIHPHISVTFAGAGGPVEASVVDGCFDPLADWALVKLAQPQTQVAPIAVGSLEPNAMQSGFSSWGYAAGPMVQTQSGMALSGHVEDRAAGYQGAQAIQLFCIQAAGGNGETLSGISGAPCMVGDLAVGIMRSELKSNEDDSTALSAGTLYACPITPRTLSEACQVLIGAVDPLPQTRPLLVALMNTVSASARTMTACGILRPFERETAKAPIAHAYVQTQSFATGSRGKNGEARSPQELTAFIGTGRDLMIIGDPGSGKSFAAAILAEQLAAPWLSDARHRGPLPLRVQARDLWSAQRAASRHAGFLDIVHDALIACSKGQGRAQERLFRRTQEAGIRKVVIVDAVDELFGDDTIDHFLHWLLSATAGQADLQLVIFSRPLPFAPDTDMQSRLQMLLMQTLSHENKLALLHAAFAVLGCPAGDAHHLLEQVETGSLVALSDNAASLMLLAVAWKEAPGKAVPRQRKELLQRFIHATAKQFQSDHIKAFGAYATQELDQLGVPLARHLALNFSELIAAVAVVTLSNPVLDARSLRGVLEGLRRNGILPESLLTGIFDDELLDVFSEFLRCSGLLVQHGSGMRFGHNLVREYLVARDWIQHPTRLETASGLPREFWRWQDPRRREILVMAMPEWLESGQFPDLRNSIHRLGRASAFGAAFIVDLYVEGATVEKEEVMAGLRIAIRKFNRCAELFARFHNPSPVPMVRRLIARPDILDEVMNDMVSDWPHECPLTASDFISISKELHDPLLLARLASDAKSSAVRFTATLALLKTGSGHALPILRRRLGSTLSGEAIRNELELASVEYAQVLMDVLDTQTMPPSVQLELLARVRPSSPAPAGITIKAIFFGTALTGDSHALPPGFVYALARELAPLLTGAPISMAPALQAYLALTLLEGKQSLLSADERGKLIDTLFDLIRDPAIAHEVAEDVFVRLAHLGLPARLRQCCAGMTGDSRCPAWLAWLDDHEVALSLPEAGGVIETPSAVSEEQAPPLQMAINAFKQETTRSTLDAMLAAEASERAQGAGSSSMVCTVLAELGEADVLLDRARDPAYADTLECAVYALAHVQSAQHLRQVIGMLAPGGAAWETAVQALAPLLTLDDIAKLYSDGLQRSVPPWPVACARAFQGVLAGVDPVSAHQLYRHGAPEGGWAPALSALFLLHGSLPLTAGALAELSSVLEGRPELIPLVLSTDAARAYGLGPALYRGWNALPPAVLKELDFDSGLLVVCNIVAGCAPDLSEQAVANISDYRLAPAARVFANAPAFIHCKALIRMLGRALGEARMQTLLTPILLKINEVNRADDIETLPRPVLSATLDILLTLNLEEEAGHLLQAWLTASFYRFSELLPTLAALEPGVRNSPLSQALIGELIRWSETASVERRALVLAATPPLLPPDALLAALLEHDRGPALWRDFRYLPISDDDAALAQLLPVARQVLLTDEARPQIRLEAAVFLHECATLPEEAKAAVATLIARDAIPVDSIASIVNMAHDLGLADKHAAELGCAVLLAAAQDASCLTPYLLCLLPASISLPDWQQIELSVMQLDEPLRSQLRYLIETRRLEQDPAALKAVGARLFRLCCLAPDQEMYRWACARVLSRLACATADERAWVQQRAWDDYWYGIAMSADRTKDKEAGAGWLRRAKNRWESITDFEARLNEGVAPMAIA